MMNFSNMWNFCTNVIGTVSSPMFVAGALSASYWTLLVTAIICLVLVKIGYKKMKSGLIASLLMNMIVTILGVLLV